MLLLFLFFILLSSLLSSAANAPLTFDNAGTVIYEAALSNTSSTPIRGVLTGKAGPNQMGIRFHLRFWNLPDDEYIQYRIHTGSSCTSPGPLFDPYQSTSPNNCDVRNPATWSSCAIGDLSGKHGPLPHSSYMTEYLEDYLSLNTANPAFFGDKLLLAFAANGSLLNCGKFRLLEGSGVPVTVPFVWPSTLSLAAPTGLGVVSSQGLDQGQGQGLRNSTGTAATMTTTTTTTTAAAAKATLCRLNQTNHESHRISGRLAPATAAAAAATSPSTPIAIHHQPCVMPSAYPSNATSIGSNIGNAVSTSAQPAAMALTGSTAAGGTQTISSPSTGEEKPATTTSSTTEATMTTAHLRFPVFKHNSDSHGGGAATSDGSIGSGAGAGGKHVVGAFEMAIVGALFVLLC